MPIVFESFFLHTVYVLCSRLAFTVVLVCIAYLYLMCATADDLTSVRLCSDVFTQTCMDDDTIEFILPTIDNFYTLDESDIFYHEEVCHTNSSEDSMSSDGKALDILSSGPHSSVESTSSDRLPLSAPNHISLSSNDNISRDTIGVYIRQSHHRPDYRGVPYIRKVEFYMDSGCTNHVTHDLSLLHDIVLRNKSFDIGVIHRCVPGASVRIEGYGNIPGLGRVLYTPSITRNLLSVSQLDRSGYNINTDANGAITGVLRPTTHQGCQ